MKKSPYFILIAFALFNQAYAQLPFNTIDSITINNIHASMLVHGDMWWDPTQSNITKCNLLTSNNDNINFASALWMSGYDGSGQLHVAAQTYRQDGNDYWPGPINSGAAISYDNSKKWAKIWKVNRADIDAFRAQSSHTFINTDVSILTWPGKNNSFARGNNNEPLVIDEDMAPFVDLNGNDKYEPLAGEYPAIKGEQALWWVFNDNGPTHSQSNGSPLGVQVKTMCYGYKRGTIIDDVLYYEYTATNFSANNYTNFRMAIWDDVDLGYYLDDYIGFDSSHRMGICYNSTSHWGNVSNAYGPNPPMTGVTMIELPGDTASNYVPAGSFMYYNNDASIIGNPTSDVQYNYYMRSRFASGAHLTHDALGSPAFSGPDCNYIFTGDMEDHAGWSECAYNNTPGDARFIVSSNDFTLNAGETKRMVWALIVAEGTGGCGIGKFDLIKTLADTAWGLYHNPPTAVMDVVQNTFSIYPNPAYDRLYIKDADGYSDITEVAIINTLGQKMPTYYDEKEKYITLTTLPTGVYYLQYIKNGFRETKTFIKQ